MSYLENKLRPITQVKTAAQLLSQKILPPDPGTLTNSSFKSPTEMQLQLSFDMGLKTMTLNYS